MNLPLKKKTLKYVFIQYHAVQILCFPKSADTFGWYFPIMIGEHKKLNYYMHCALRKPDWSRKKKFSCTCKMKKCLVFPLFFYFLNNFLKIIKNQQVKQFLQNKKHLIRYEELKPVLTQFFFIFRLQSGFLRVPHIFHFEGLYF